jgi:hypothetical protein
MEVSSQLYTRKRYSDTFTVRMGGPQSGSGHCRKEKNLLILPENRIPVIQSIAMLCEGNGEINL